MNGLRATTAVQQISHWITTGEIVPLVGLYTVLSLGDLWLQRVLRQLVHREWVHGTPVNYRVHRLLRAYAPSNMLIRYLSDAPVTAPYADVEPPQNLWKFLAVQAAITIGVATEEGVFRGLPYLGAAMVGIDPLWPVAAGTVVWAVLHGKGRGIAILLTSGWLYVALWGVGHWEIAIGLHLATNLSVFTYGYHDGLGLEGG